MEDRWTVLESHLPPGTKCEERLEMERWNLLLLLFFFLVGESCGNIQAIPLTQRRQEEEEKRKKRQAEEEERLKRDKRKLRLKESREKRQAQRKNEEHHTGTVTER